MKRKNLVSNNNKNCTFIFGKQNRILRNVREYWERYENFDVFVIIGPPGVGKSTFLQSIKLGDIQWFNQEIIEKIIIEANTGNVVEPLQNIIFIEDVDYLARNKYKRKAFVELLKRWRTNKYGERRLIICTFNCITNISDFENFQVLHMQPLKISQSVVKEKAKILGIKKLTTEELSHIARLDTVLEVEEELRRIRAYEIIFENDIQ